MERGDEDARVHGKGAHEGLFKVEELGEAVDHRLGAASEGRLGEYPSEVEREKERERRRGTHGW